jgi:curved DNA-binding protein
VEFIDYYAVLGVPKTATKEEIERAYRKKARQFHPDVNKAKDAEDKFKKVGEAYEVLADPAKRALYDQYGNAWKEAERQGAPPPGAERFRTQRGAQPDSQEFHFEGGDFSEFFEQLFGMGGRGRGGRGRAERGGRGSWTLPGADQEAGITLTLEQAAEGGQRQMSLQDPRTGRSRTLKVNIPKGVLPGQRIRLSGLGDPGQGGGPAGDLYLNVDIAPHADFRLDGRDLHTVLPVTPWDAALGGEALLRTLGGTVRVKIPAGSSSGRRIRLRGQGYPDPRGGAGDLYAEIRIVVPEKLTPEERELFEKLSKASSFTPPGQHPQRVPT